MKLFYYLYALASVGVLLSFDVFWQFEMVHIISKGLLMPLLILAAIFSGKITQGKKLLIAGLVFCGCGDLFLLDEENELFFMFGLGAFLIGHIFFALSFRNTVETGHEIAILIKNRLWVFLFIILGAGIFLYMRPDLGEMEIPVLLYTGAIVYMAMQAFNRYERTDSTSFWLVLLGAVLFMTSDTLIGINKFKDPIPHAGYWIMGLYMLSQFMIVKGMLGHKNMA